jgi:uncharacterized protein YprB with RNaseH-like and TPR domain
MIKIPITKLLFIDIETVGLSKNYPDCVQNHPSIANQFNKYFDWFLKRFPEDNIKDLGPESLKEYVFFKRTALVPEFAKIICVCLGFITNDNKIHKQIIIGHDEVDILKETNRLLDYFNEKDFYLCGHNLKNFDIPMLSKRMVINGILPSKLLPSYDTKPWDFKVVDTKELWQFGSYSSISSLDLMCTALGVESPKNSEIKGDDVHEAYWTKDMLHEISQYCEKDVLSLIEVVKKLNSLS